jgi:hypothetical protein
MFQKIELRKTRDFSTKINITFEFIRQNFKVLGLSMLYVSGPFVLIGGFFSGLYQEKSLTSSGQSILESIFNEWYALMTFFLLLGNVSILVVVNEFVRLYEIKEDPSTILPSEIWEGVKENFFRILLSMVVVGLVITVACVLLLFPGIYVATVLALITPIMIIEKRSLGDAFNRCFFLISEKWWSTFGLLVVTFLIAGFMGYIFALPQLVFTFIFAMHKTTDALTEPALWERVGIVFSAVITSVGSSMLKSIVYVATIFQFYNLVERREAQGLMNKLESFGKTDVNAPRHDETY